MSDEYCTSCGRCKNCGSMRPLGNDLASGAYMQPGAGASQITVMTVPNVAAGAAAQPIFGCSHTVAVLT